MITFLSESLKENYSLVHAEDCAALRLRFSNHYYPEGHTYVVRNIPYQQVDKFGIDMIKIHMYLIHEELMDYLYKQHGNGD